MNGYQYLKSLGCKLNNLYKTKRIKDKLLSIDDVSSVRFNSNSISISLGNIKYLISKLPEKSSFIILKCDGHNTIIKERIVRTFNESLNLIGSFSLNKNFSILIGG